MNIQPKPASLQGMMPRYTTLFRKSDGIILFSQQLWPVFGKLSATRVMNFLKADESCWICMGVTTTSAAGTHRNFSDHNASAMHKALIHTASFLKVAVKQTYTTVVLGKQ